MALTKCRECKEMVSTKADACPKCGAKQNATSKAVADILGGLFALVIFVVIGISLLGDFAQMAEESQQTPEEMLQELERQCKASVAEMPKGAGDKQMMFESCVAGGRASLRAKGIIE